MSGSLPQIDTLVINGVLTTFYEDEFQEKEFLAKGGEAFTYSVTTVKNGKVCAKLHFADPANNNRKEVETLLKHHYHPNIIRIFGIIESRHSEVPQKHLGYVMEFMSGGSLHSVIRRESEKYDFYKALNWIGQAARGLQYLHERKIIHRDIKPNNMLLDGTLETLKLSDFGLAKKFDNTTFDKSPGTCSYMAPELILVAGNPYTFAVDIYALAISIWEVLHRRDPYDYASMTYYVMFNMILNGERPTISKRIDERTRKIIESGWSADPSHRCSVMDIISFATEMMTKIRKITRSSGPPSPMPLPSPPLPQSEPANLRARAIDRFRFSEEPKSPTLKAMPPTSLQETKEEYAFRCLTQLYFYIQPEDRFKATVLQFRKFLQELEGECLNPRSLVPKFFVVGPNGVVPNGQEVFEKFGYALNNGEDISFGSDNRRFIFKCYYIPVNCGQKTAAKVKHYQTVLDRIESIYQQESTRLSRHLLTQKFNCLFVGGPKTSARRFLERLAGTSFSGKGLLNPMKLYDLNYYALDLPSSRPLCRSTDLIWNEINKVKKVHRLCFLIDSSNDYGTFGPEWMALGSYVYSSFYLACDGDEETARSRFLGQFTGKTNIGAITFRKEEMFGGDLTASTQVYEPFFMAYMKCMENLVAKREPLLPLASLNNEPRTVIMEGGTRIK